MILWKMCTQIVCVLVFIWLRTTHCTTTKYYSYEEDAPGTEIGNLSKDLKIELGQNSQTSFRFMQKTNFSHVHLRQIDGLLTVGENIDREELCPKSLECLVAFDIVTFSKERFQLIHVEIEVMDINDNSPRFPSNESYLEISENVAVGTRFPLDVAVDQDVGINYIQSYQISFSSHFGVEVREEEDGLKYAELILLKELDREADDFYTIELTAVDGGKPPRTGSMTVIVKVLDFNDNSPTFEHSSLKVELNEDEPLGFLLLKVHASDPDAGINGQVVYGFAEETSDEIRRVFQIDSFSGSLTLNAAVDYENRKLYELNIQAYDLGLNSVPSTCRVTVEIIDVNDNVPEISIKPMTSMSEGVAYITEAAAEESFVALISASDRDAGPNGYVRISLHGHDHFKLQQAYGDTFMIVTTTALDRERLPEYNLTVVAEDFGSPPFKTLKQYTIRVSDENDNPPLFSKPVYELAVMENNVPGSYIATVVARDPDLGDNSKVTYKLLDGEVTGGAPLSACVTVDPLSGSLYSARSFDYEAVKQIEVKIEASDSGFPQLSSTALIEIKIVDQNDNSPYITYPVLQNDSADVPIPVNAPSGYVALRVKARDADEGFNGKLSFRLIEDDQILFTMHRDTGEIALKHGLSFLCGDVLQIKIAVSDNGRPPRSCKATIRFVVAEMQLADERSVLVMESTQDAWYNMEASQVVIIMLGGGCVLLIIAIATVALSCKRNPRDRECDGKRIAQGHFEKQLLPTHSDEDPDIYQGPKALVSGQNASLQRDSFHFYRETGNDPSNKGFPAISTKRFEPASLWQGDKDSLQISGTEQMSVKDSGKGDSDFNDSDSDISGFGCKRTSSMMGTRETGSFHSASTLSSDQQNRYNAVPTHLTVACRTTYAVAFSQMPVRASPHASAALCRGSGYGPGISQPRVPLQTFSRSATMPPGFNQHGHQAETQPGEQQRQNRAPPSPVRSEVATSL
ncbi:protocadherin-8 [Brienomyrus brachyistius]|uniref:protocadherin-8 n=1 Tax=Brienomyrus brachyistius TaxID=42636 RepID=UPI0020B29BDC|nr:protocadherin-8 [Brienomyrus brachyistius]